MGIGNTGPVAEFNIQVPLLSSSHGVASTQWYPVLSRHAGAACPPCARWRTAASLAIVAKGDSCTGGMRLAVLYGPCILRKIPSTDSSCGCRQIRKPQRWCSAAAPSWRWCPWRSVRLIPMHCAPCMTMPESCRRSTPVAGLETTPCMMELTVQPAWEASNDIGLASTTFWVSFRSFGFRCVVVWLIKQEVMLGYAKC